MRKILMVFASAMSAMVASAETIYVSQANFANYRVLMNGNTYRFVEDIDWTAPVLENAMKVDYGASVVIDIPPTITVRLTGGDASGALGAGAGIEVPSKTKLTITGSGTLYVNGGNATNGANGEQGKGAVITDESYWYTTSGSGGLGGNGGGGAGAGIGGKGGHGGIGGMGAAGVTDNWSGSYKQSGKAGNPGSNGDKGQACGAVEICGAVTVIAKGGSSASRGGYGGDYSGREIAEGQTWYGAGYGGGGGGGGGGGVAASDIGGGGGGGGAGGGGGSGGICYFDDVDTVLMCKLNGDGGNGGKGVVGDVGFVNDYDGGFYTTFKENLIWPGEETSAKINTVPYSSYTPGSGGAGGAVGAMGDNGSLTVESTASCICGTRNAYNVGKISDTEYIRWENEKLWRVKDGVYTEIAYETVQGWTGNLDGGKWYVVKGIVHRTDTINVGEGEAANLVLLDRTSLTVDRSHITAGGDSGAIGVAGGRTLNIFGVLSGTLTAIGGCRAAGIGGGNKQTMGTLTIYGGTISATGGEWGAGIGSGNEDVGGGTVTINGGVVMAQGGEGGGAGIGGGDAGKGSDVTINGGSVTAYAGNKGAQSIGKGDEGANSGSLTLAPCVFKIDDNHYREGICVSFPLPSYLRLVSAVDGNGSALRTSTRDGVVSVCALSLPRVTMTFGLAELGYRFTGSNVISVGPFYGGETLSPDALPQVKSVTLSFVVPDSLCLVSAVADNGTQVRTKTVGGITYVSSFPDCRVKLTFVPKEAGYYLPDNGVIIVEPINENTTLSADDLPKIEEDPFSGSVEYLLADGSAAKAFGVRRVDQAAALQSTLSSGWYSAVGDVTTSALNVQGTVNLILVDGATLKVNGGIRVNEGNTLNVFCQEGGTGRLVANGSACCAGIGGGGTEQSMGALTINGGTVTATGGEWGAGIGGGSRGAGGTITINGGTVSATGGEYGAGIGGGLYGTGGTVAINGGTVTATGRDDGAGIGGGYKGADAVVTLDKTKVEVIEGMYGNGHSYVKIVEKPTCKGGTIAKSQDGVWVITPNEGVTEVKISNLPEGEMVVVPPTISKVVGVEDEQIMVFDGESDITDFFSIENGVITQIVLTVTVSGDITHLTVAYTFGDGAVTNAISGTSFSVQMEMTNVKVIFTPAHNYQFKSESEDGVRALTSPLIESCTVTAPEVEGLPGTDIAPWQVGENVTAYVSDEGVLVIGGEGAMDDFASVEEVPWTDKAAEIKSVTIAEGVTKIGAKSWEGLSGTVTVNGMVLSAIRFVSTGLNISAEPVIPEDMVLVSKTEIEAAKATTIQVVDGTAYLDVNVSTNADLTAEIKSWGKVKLDPATVKQAADGHGLVVPVPAKADKGFMILRSSDGK